MGQDGRTALVTGAARRIGAAIAERLSAQGFATALHASRRAAPEAGALAERLIARGGRAVVVVADLAIAAEAEALIARAAAALGPLDALVNNASIFEPDSAADFDLDRWERQFAVNLRAPALLVRAFARQAPRERDPAVVNILDQRVWRPNPQFFSYTLSKAALWTATRTMAQSFAPHVRVNAVGPGPVLPNETQGAEGFAREVAGLPLGRPVPPGAIAEAVSYLLSARHVTGQMIAVDSGQHLGWRTPDYVEDEMS
jgi:NAD(P)-dependent dehydrogenase (short-subunit alcohol dehydrogenase family)